MNETSKTVAFIITAGILGVVAGWSHWMTKPKPVVGFEKVGEEFFPDFQDGTTATSLMVTAFDNETEGLREFSVKKQDDGLWRIPSHHDYPAEAADRLARTATSLIGVERESIVERRVNKHAEYGVLDPADPEADADSAGKRITLRDAAGEIVSDFIIGKPAGSVAKDASQMVRDIEQESDYFYVRVPAEKETYKAKVKIDLSTQFADWINPDLLKLQAADINRLELDNYELTEQDVQVGNRIMTQMSKKVIDQQALTRDGFEPWELDGLNPATEEIDTLKVESIATLLDTMKIVGVRPKQKLDGQLLVKSDLTINEELARKDPRQFQNRILALQSDLDSKGFTIGQTTEEGAEIALMASRGELRAATKNGVLYTLYFGRSVSGDSKAIEIGTVDADAETEEAPADDTEKEGDSEAAAGTAEGETEGDVAAENKSRYVAIRVDFDPAALGEKPTMPEEPTAPVKPEGFDEWKKQREAKLMEAAKAAEAGEQAAGEDQEPEGNEDSPPGAPEDIANANDEKYEKYELEAKAFEQAEVQYTTDVELFETQKAEYEGREKVGREMVEELNERFAEWFYVVPAESLATLKLTRSDIVKQKELPPPNPNAPMSPGQMPSGLPDAPNIGLPGGAPDKAEETDPNKDEMEGNDAASRDDGSEDDAKEASDGENTDGEKVKAESAEMDEDKTPAGEQTAEETGEPEKPAENAEEKSPPDSKEGEEKSSDKKKG